MRNAMPVTVWEYNAEMKVTGREGGGGEELHNLCFLDDQIKADKTHRTRSTNRYMRDS